MNIAKNFHPVSDAPVVRTSLMYLVQMLSNAAANHRQYAVVSKWVGPNNSTTVYCPEEHVIYRAVHKSGVRRFLAAVAEQAPERIRLLDNDEMLTIKNDDSVDTQ